MDLRKARALQYYIIKIQAVVRGFLARVCTQQMMKEFMWIQENISNQLNDLQCSSHNEMCCDDYTLIGSYHSFICIINCGIFSWK